VRLSPDPRRLRPIFAALLVALFVCPSSVAGQAARPASALDPAIFPVPDVLVPNVEFWRAIFSKYESTQTVIHDNLNLDVIYSVVDVGDLKRQGASDVVLERTSRNRVRAEIRKYENVLKALAGVRGATADPADMARVRGLFAASARGKSDFRAAIDRVRGQGGLRDIFHDALATSGMFMPGIEEIFTRYGVPADVARLPFVESMFNYEARSKVGASGVWQFTRSTGRLYLQINSAVDERSDVWLAADGAARLLADHYERLQSWPLAITAYNHGVAGMVRAVSQVGSRDIGQITERYQSRSFGFASRNFYAEFVAVATIYAERDRVFPDVQLKPPIQFDEFRPDKFVSLLDLAHLTRTPVDTIAVLNPALDTEVVRGRLLIPANYPLRVPEGLVPQFKEAFAKLPDTRKLDRQLAMHYRVQRGDTLGGLARRFGTTVSALQQANQLRRSTIYVGQVLEMPSGQASWTPLVWKGVEPAGGELAAAAVHIVRAGETLSRIARQYGTTVQNLIRTNNLISTVIHVGQELQVPSRR
jgi:membrane-bound lytic murein transglycosylase D